MYRQYNLVFLQVSVKTLDLLKCNAYVLKNLKREAAILNQLNHPHILRLFETLRVRFV